MALAYATFVDMPPRKRQATRSPEAGPAETLGARIRRYRKWRNLEQENLGELIGSDASHISQIETGKIKSPDLKTLKKMAVALRVPLHDLARPLEWYSDLDVSELATTSDDPLETIEAIIKSMPTTQMSDARKAAGLMVVRDLFERARTEKTGT